MQQAITQQQSLREIWYNKTFVLLEICKLSKNRELSFLPTDDSPNRVRCINSSFVDILKKNFEGFHFMQRNFNLYYSLAHIKNMPMFSFNPSTRKLQQAEFNRSFDKYFYNFDPAFDFDGNKLFNRDIAYLNNKRVIIERKHYGKEGVENIDILQDGIIKCVNSFDLKEIPINEQISRAKADLLILKKELDNYKIPYMCKFSGSKGFHINIDGKNLPDVSPMKKVEIADKLTNEFSKILKLETLDCNLMEKRRIWKCPFSLVNTKVCLPLSDSDINYFDIKKMEVLYVLGNKIIKNMGLLERNNDYPTPQLQINFKKMLKDYEVI